MSKILSQQEIEALLEAIKEEDIFFEEIDDKDFQDKAVIYEFKESPSINKKYLNLLKKIHSEISINLARDFSFLIKDITEVTLYSIERVPYNEFIKNLPSYTSFNIFSLKPLDIKGVIEINPNIAFFMIDRLLGGVGYSFEINREFTDIELGILEKILEVITHNMKKAWTHIKKLTPVIEIKASIPTLFPITSKNDMVLVVKMEVKVGNISGFINICYSSALINKLLSRLEDKNLFNKELRLLLKGAKINLEAILGYASLDMKEILDLEVGDIIVLDKIADNNIMVEIEGKPKFSGDLIVRDDKKCVRIKEKFKTSYNEIKETLKEFESSKIKGIGD